MELIDAPDKRPGSSKQFSYWLKLGLTVIGCNALMFGSMFVHAWIKRYGQEYPHEDFSVLIYLLIYPLTGFLIGLGFVVNDKGKNPYWVGVFVFALMWMLLGLGLCALN